MARKQMVATECVHTDTTLFLLKSAFMPKCMKRRVAKHGALTVLFQASFLYRLCLIIPVGIECISALLGCSVAGASVSIDVPD